MARNFLQAIVFIVFLVNTELTLRELEAQIFLFICVT